MKTYLFISFLLSLLICCSLSQDNCKGTPNTNPIYSKPPVFANKTTNGALYLQTSLNPPLYVLHVYGTPYEMGYAQGQLMKYQIQELVPLLFEYLYSYAEPYIDFLPPKIQKMVLEAGWEAVLDLTIELTKDYTPQHFLDEIQGIADGSGLDAHLLLQVNLIPEVIKAHCSMYGAWGKAIEHVEGSLFQLRALDWDTDGPFQLFPTYIVYHPENDNGHDFAILTYPAFIGALTGYSSAPVGICEKVWLNYNGTDSRSGYPWHFLLRDILQYDVDISSALTRIANAKRTCSIFVGVGDYTNNFRVIEYSHDYIEIYDDRNQPVWDDHPSFQNLVYVDKHSQPSSDPCMPSLLEKNYGYLNATTTIQIASIFQTGDTHCAVYDYYHNLVYVANASPAPNPTPAYDQPFIMLNMTTLFDTTAN